MRLKIKKSLVLKVEFEILWLIDGRPNCPPSSWGALAWYLLFVGVLK